MLVIIRSVNFNQKGGCEMSKGRFKELWQKKRAEVISEEKERKRLKAHEDKIRPSFWRCFIIYTKKTLFPHFKFYAMKFMIALLELLLLGYSAYSAFLQNVDQINATANVSNRQLLTWFLLCIFFAVFAALMLAFVIKHILFEIDWHYANSKLAKDYPSYTFRKIWNEQKEAKKNKLIKEGKLCSSKK